MGASTYVGRVGGLAVALGVGAAVATGHGVAWATEGDNTTSSASEASSTSKSTSNSTSESTSEQTTGSQTQTPTDVESDPDLDADPEEDVDLDVDLDLEEPKQWEESEESEDAEELEDSDKSDESEEPEGTPEAPQDTEVDPDAPPVIESSGNSNAGRANDDEDAEQQSAALADDAPESTVADKLDDKVALDVDARHVDRKLQSVSLVSDEVQAFSTAVDFVSPAVVTTTPPQPLLQRIVLSVLSSLGVGQWVANLPGAPIWGPIAMALLGWGSRREVVSPLAQTVSGQPVAALTLTDLAAAAAAVTTYPGTARKPVYVSANTRWIEFVTGPGNLNNTTARFGIGGTDLGIMWDNGITDNPATTTINEHQVLIAFGDTFSNRTPVRTGVWRFNTLFRTADGVLNDGLYVPDGVPVNHVVLPPNGAHFSGSPMEKPNWSDPILPSPGDAVHPPYAIGPEVTIIPTAGISVPYDNAYGARQYMSFMSIRSWDTPGRWTTNYSGIAYSDDNGQTWDIAPTSIRSAATGRATVPFVSGNQNFQQAAFVKPPAGSPEATEGWVYAYGTPSGRAGTLYLSRVQQDQILDVTKYQYWNGSTWVENEPSAAAPVLPAKTTSFFGFFKSTKYPAVSELSVQYNPYLNKYVMLYGNSSNRIVMRTADSPEGVWSKETTLVGSWTLSGKYAPYIHPWSGTDNLSVAEQQYLYWNLSTWGDYQVRLMRTDLSKIKV